MIRFQLIEYLVKFTKTLCHAFLMPLEYQHLISERILEQKVDRWI